MRIRGILLVIVATLLAATGFAASTVPTGSSLGFAHFANGSESDGTWKTDFNFVNNSPSMTTGHLRLFDNNGAPFTLGTTIGTGSSFTFTIPAHGSLDIVTNGNGSVAVGWAFASFDQTVLGSAIYSLFTADGQAVSVGVLGGFPKTTLSSPANGGDGIAIVNPGTTADPFNTGSAPVKVTAIDATGKAVGSATLTLAQGQHYSNNLTKVISGLSPTFTGSVTIQSSGAKIQAVVLGVKPNAKLFVAYPQPAISYNNLATSYSGSFTVLFGPDANAMGTAMISNIRYLNSTSILADIQVSIGGNNYSGPLISSVDDYGIVYSMDFQFPQLSNSGLAIGFIIPPGVPVSGGIGPGTFIVLVADLGNGASAGQGDFGVMLLTPQ